MLSEKKKVMDVWKMTAIKLGNQNSVNTLKISSFTIINQKSDSNNHLCIIISYVRINCK